MSADPGTQTGSPQSSPVPWSAQANSPAPTVQTSYASSANRVSRNGLTLSSEFEDVDSGSDPRASSLTQPLFGSTLHNTSLLEHKGAGKISAMNACMLNFRLLWLKSLIKMWLNCYYKVM